RSRRRRSMPSSISVCGSRSIFTATSGSSRSQRRRRAVFRIIFRTRRTRFVRRADSPPSCHCVIAWRTRGSVTCVTLSSPKRGRSFDLRTWPYCWRVDAFQPERDSSTHCAAKALKSGAAMQMRRPTRHVPLRLPLCSWDDVVRRVAGHRCVLECHGAAAAGVDTAAILPRDVSGDGAVIHGERGGVVDAAAKPLTVATANRRVSGDEAVVDAECARVADGAAIGGLVAGDGAVVDAECAAVVYAAADGAGEGAAGERTVVDGGDAAVEDVGARDAVVAGERGVRDSERATVEDAAAHLRVVAGERAAVDAKRACVEDATASLG